MAYYNEDINLHLGDQARGSVPQDTPTAQPEFPHIFGQSYFCIYCREHQNHRLERDECAIRLRTALNEARQELEITKKIISDLNYELSDCR